jgi:radical SAM superfamily enzyme YgiQ (UPF0313 family)
MSLYAYLESKGHQAEVLIYSEEGKRFWDKVKEFKPDWVGFSSILTLHLECYWLAQEVKERFGFKTVFGGPYISYFPQAINRSEVDVIIRGEGEEALLDLLEATDKSDDCSGIPNLWMKRDGKVISNPVRPFEKNLDKYPVPRREHYYKYRLLKNHPLKHFISGRDCPYNCYFCFNQQFRVLYNVGSYAMRRRSPEHVLEELIHCRESYPLKMLAFDDDVFPINMAWLSKFLPHFKKEINVPFSCNIHTNVVNEEVVRILRENGCRHVMMGLESGSPRVRREILGKKFSNEQFLKSVDILHKHGIRIMTYNILGSPTENLEEAFQTVTLNNQARIEYPWWSIYQPQLGTQTCQIALEKGYIPEDNPMDNASGSIFKRSVLQQPEIKEIVRLHKLFYLGVKFRPLIPLIKKLVKVELGPIYTFIFLITYFIRHWKESGAGFFQVVWLGLKQLRNY